MTDAPRPPRRPPPSSGSSPTAGGQSRSPHNTGYLLAPGGPTRPSPESDYLAPLIVRSYHTARTSHPPSPPSTVGYRPMPTRGGGPPSTAGFIPMPYDPLASHRRSGQFLTTSSEVRPEPTSVQERAVVELNELSRMVCGEHYHNSNWLDLIPSGRTEGYSVQWECEMLVWNLKVCVNCGFRRITCSKRVPICNKDGKLISLKTRLRIVGVWEGTLCEHVLQLHRIGQLNKDWWKNDVDLTGEREMKPEPGYKTWAPSHVRCYPPVPERSRRTLELRPGATR